MEVLYIGLKKPSIIPSTILMTMVSMMMKVLECLHVMEGVDIRLLIPSTFSPVIVEFIIVMIKVVSVVEVSICIKRPGPISHNR